MVNNCPLKEVSQDEVLHWVWVQYARWLEDVRNKMEEECTSIHTRLEQIRGEIEKVAAEQIETTVVPSMVLSDDGVASVGFRLVGGSVQFNAYSNQVSYLLEIVIRVLGETSVVIRAYHMSMGDQFEKLVGEYMECVECQRGIIKSIDQVDDLLANPTVACDQIKTAYVGIEYIWWVCD